MCPEEGGQLNIKEREKGVRATKEQIMKVFRTWMDAVIPLPETGEKEIKICVVVGTFNAQGKETEGERTMASSVPEND